MERVAIQIHGGVYKTEMIVGKRTISSISRYIDEFFEQKHKLAIISDEIVFGLYGDKLLRALGEQDSSNVYLLPNGESGKRFNMIENICAFLSERGLTRSDILIGLGGGAVTDMASFAASVYMRGMKLVLLPTTLLAMCDASLGGKTAVDTTFGKNLIGTFFPARLVAADTSTLSTLSDEQISDGAAEIIKTAFAAFNAGYGDYLLCKCEDIRVDYVKIVTLCANIKAFFVQSDMFDSLNKRELLNFGHTIGHAVEFLSDYGITHGHAVSIGLAAAAKASVRMRLCSARVRDKLISLLESYNLPVECEFSVDEVFNAAKADKKRRGDSTRIIILRNRGLEGKTVDDEGLLEFIRLGLK